MSRQQLWLEWLVSNPAESLILISCILWGPFVLGSFQSFYPYLDFSSDFLSSFSWQYLLTKVGGAFRSCLWRLLQCVYLPKRIDQPLLRAVLHIRSWAGLSSPVMVWSSRMICRKTTRANYRARSDFQMPCRVLRNLVLWMNPIYILVGIGKVGF